PRFFATMQTALLAGREFTSADSAGAPLVAIVDETFARRHFPNTGAVGQRMSARVRGKVGDLEIVGIAQNTKAAGLRRRPYPSVYVPYAQLTGNFPTTLNIRVSGSLVGVGSEVKRVLQPKLPDMPLEVRPLTAQGNAAMLR